MIKEGSFREAREANLMTSWTGKRALDD